MEKECGTYLPTAKQGGRSARKRVSSACSAGVSFASASCAFNRSRDVISSNQKPQPPGIFILCKTVYSPMREPSGKANCSCRSGIINNGA